MTLGTMMAVRIPLPLQVFTICVMFAAEVYRAWRGATVNGDHSDEPSSEGAEAVVGDSEPKLGKSRSEGKSRQGEDEDDDSKRAAQVPRIF
jgi:hypothetical protein